MIWVVAPVEVGLPRPARPTRAASSVTDLAQRRITTSREKRGRKQNEAEVHSTHVNTGRRKSDGLHVTFERVR